MLKYMSALFFTICGCVATHAAEPLCRPDLAESLKKTTVGIERVYDHEEISADDVRNEVYGVRATAWFLDKHTIVTIEHVVTGSRFSRDWKEARLFWSDTQDAAEDHSHTSRVRIKEIVVGDPRLEALVALELETPVEGSKIGKVRARPLQRSEPVIGIGYAGGMLRFARGHFKPPEPQHGDRERGSSPPYLLFELADWEKKNGIRDRYVLNNGASGGPIFDCDGNIVAVVRGLFKRSMSFAGVPPIEITTAWGEANVGGVSASSLIWNR